MPLRFCAALLVFLLSTSFSEVRAESRVTFVDITKKAGLSFSHNSGAFGLKLWPEPFGSGGCFFDYDHDGWQDILLVNSTDWPDEALTQARDRLLASSVEWSNKAQKQAAAADARRAHLLYEALKRKRTDRPNQSNSLTLYRNNHDGTLTDQTAKARLAGTFYGMGCAVADYDNDGDQDLYITAYGGGRLWTNNGDGTFTDGTGASKIVDHGWSTCAVWFDFDRDGDLDLFICHYVDWTLETNFQCGLDQELLVYCGPDAYPTSPQMLWRNNGDGTFTDSPAAGLAQLKGKALGAAIFDDDDDGWPDLVVANDQIPNHLLRNNRAGTFTDQSTLLGFSAGRFGIAKAGMGIDIADYQNNHRVGILVGNFAKEGLTLHQQGDGGVFKDQAPRLGLTRSSLPFLTFGLFFFDYDLDGLLDILVANGHIDETTVNYLERDVTYKQRPLLFHHQGDGSFVEVGLESGRALRRALVGRGAAYADVDHDGDLDVLLTQNNGPPVLLRNDGGNRNRWLRVALVGTKSNRDGIGATVTVRTGSLTQRRLVKTGSSYLSQSELPVTFGLGKAARVDEVVIQWPSGIVDHLKDLSANQKIEVIEGSTAEISGSRKAEEGAQ